MVGPMIPPDMGNEKGVKFTRESLPVFGDAGSDFGWTIAKYQSLSSCTSAGECTVKETVHSEFGLEGVRSLVVNDVDPSFVPGVAGKVGAMSGQTSWDDICESARPWLNGKDPADVLPPCGSSRNTAYMLWAFSAMTAAFSAGLSWFICCCPFKTFRRIGGALAMLSVTLGGAGMGIWMGMLNNMESQLGCEAVLRIGAAASFGMENDKYCTNWHDVLSTATVPVATKSLGGKCIFNSTAIADRLGEDPPPASAWAGSSAANGTYLFTHIQQKSNVLKCGPSTGTMLAGLAIAFVSLAALLFCCVSGEAEDALNSDSDDDDETRQRKRIARVKRDAAAARKAEKESQSGFETVAATAGSGAGSDGASQSRRPRKKQEQPSGYGDPLSAQFGAQRMLPHQASVRNPVALDEDTDVTSI